MTASASPTTTALLALMKIKGVGRRTALEILDAPASSLDQFSFRDTVASKTRKVRLPEGALVEAWLKAQEQLQRSSDTGIRAISFHDEEYPTRLRRIPDPPAILYVRGDASALRHPRTVAIIGTREPTEYGEKVARKSGHRAAEFGFCVVSGLAHGCDAFAHEGCVEARGVGVAVLAHGLDRVYPAANRALAEDLLAHGGCLVSEYPIGFTPMRTAFVERDRIQSGLSDAVLVIETDVKGGTMHTVRFAREQRRPLACIAHPEHLCGEEKTRGNQKLIADGWATPIPDGDAFRAFLDRHTIKLEDTRATPPISRDEPRQKSWSF